MPQTPPIHFSPDQIPEVKHPMPLLRLGASVMASDAILQELVQAVAPGAELKELGNTGARAAYDGNRLVAFVHPTTGESRVFPALEALSPGQGLGERAKQIASRIAEDASLFPKDGTLVAALAPVTLFGSTHTRDAEQSAPMEYLSFVRLQRQFEGIPVFGLGTRAMIAVAADDSIHAFAHRWRQAMPGNETITPFPREQVAESILTQLATSAKSAEVTVDSVTVGYYDGGRDFLQPVYRFEATVAFTNPELHAANRRVFGYVPIGKEPEPLPVLGILQGKPPEEPPILSRGNGAADPVPPGDPTVGRYVVRNDSDEWVTSANEFLDGLNEGGIFFGSPISFTNSQYYWAEPFEFISDKDNFVNSVHIALNEVHGNWGLFSTRDNADDLVSLSSIPSTGFGGGAGGSLAYWIIHSCEVIPTQTDETTSFDVWWNIFNGLHAAVGYRTEMWIDDDVTGPFGFSVGLGAPVVSAWLSEVASNDSYDDGDTYHDNNRNIDEPMGRASAIAVCGHSDDTANDIGSLGRANCLTEWWFDN